MECISILAFINQAPNMLSKAYVSMINRVITTKTKWFGVDKVVFFEIRIDSDIYRLLIYFTKN